MATFARRLVQEGAAYAAHALLSPLAALPATVRPATDAGARTILLLHGVGASRAQLLPLAGYLRWRGHPRVAWEGYRVEGDVRALAERLARRIDAIAPQGRVDLVGHSLGGLVARVYVQLLGGEARVDRLITLATPHGGTRLCERFGSPVMRDMRPGSELLRRLDALPPPARTRVLSIGAERDLLIRPPGAALAPFGEHAMLSDLGHMDLLLSPRMFEAVHAALAG